MMPADGADQLRKFDAILFGAVGAPDIPDHITLWGLRLAICQSLDQYANVRPTRILPGITSPLRHVSGPELDWVIVRENSEAEYSGVGGRVHKGLPIEVAQDVCVVTRAGVQRIIRYAFKLAQSRPRKLLTVMTKSKRWRDALAELVTLRGEYQAWLDTLPESLEGSATAEALRSICDLGLSDLEAVEPPGGFGRD